MKKEFCNFCGDHMGSKVNECVECGSYMCEQVERFGAGCIWVGSLKPNEDFRCILCEPKTWRKLQNPPKGEAGGFPVSTSESLQRRRLTVALVFKQYGFTGYGSRKRSKLTWPLLLTSLSLSTLPDRYMRDALQIDLKNHFMATLENVSKSFLLTAIQLTHLQLEFVNVELSAGGDVSSLAKMGRGANFLRKSVRSKVPANCFILVDTHTNDRTGELYWGSDEKGVLESRTSELLQRFCGNSFMSAMKEASELAQGLKALDGEKKWYDASPYSRGGWRGLLLSTCAASMRVPGSFRDIKALVERYVDLSAKNKVQAANISLQGRF